LNIWDIGGQKAIRSYWRNYFEQSSALIWCVDSADKERLDLCKQHLHELLLEEVFLSHYILFFFILIQFYIEISWCTIINLCEQTRFRIICFIR